MYTPGYEFGMPRLIYGVPGPSTFSTHSVRPTLQRPLHTWGLVYGVDLHRNRGDPLSLSVPTRLKSQNSLRFLGLTTKVIIQKNNPSSPPP